MKLHRYEKNPIIKPDPAREWESLVTTNPGAWYDEQRKEVIMLYRAAGNDIQHVIHLGLATSKNGFDFHRASNKPAVSPVAATSEGGCFEDPRIVKIGEWYYGGADKYCCVATCALEELIDHVRSSPA